MPLLTRGRREWSAPLRRQHPGRRRSLVLLLALLAAIFVAAPVGPAAGDDLSAAIARQRHIEAQIRAQKAMVAALNKSQASLKTNIANTRTSLASVNADLSAVAAQINDLGREIALVKGRIHGIEAQAIELDFDLATIIVKQDVKAEELRARKQLLAERIRNAYDTDRTPLLEALLTSESFTDVLTEVGYHLDVATEDRALAEGIMQDEETLAALRATVSETKAQSDLLHEAAASEKRQLDADLTEMTAARARLKELQAETKRLLDAQQANYATMVRQEKSLTASIAAGERAEKQLEREIARLTELKARQGAIPSKYNGTLRWPLIGIVTQNFGCTGFPWEPPLGTCRHFHRGIDIAAPMYRPIRAAGAGLVLIAGPNPYEHGGNRAWIVAIAHSSELITWYGHLDNRAHPPAVKVGQYVKAGQIIGYVGMTGRTTGPHLHWAVQFRGQFRNPRLFL